MEEMGAGDVDVRHAFFLFFLFFFPSPFGQRE